MKLIPLTKNKHAIVSDKDYNYLSQFSWHYNNGYARANIKGKEIYMHRLIMGDTIEQNIDHINHHKLDNRRINLRVVTQAQNVRNKVKSKNNKTGYKGVFINRHGTYTAQITFNYKCISLGNFKNKHDAAEAYNRKAKELHGDYAKLNDIKRGD